MWRTTLWLWAGVMLGAAGGADLGLRCPKDAGRRCKSVYIDDHTNEYQFEVDGCKQIIKYRDGGNFVVRCSNCSSSLASVALPHISNGLRVKNAVFYGCALPVDTYVAVLRALNLTVLMGLQLRDLAAGALLTAAHLEGLAVTSLHISGAARIATANVAPAALAALSSLIHLTLRQVRLPPDDWRHLPPALETLDLWYVGLGYLKLSGLPLLKVLNWHEDSPVTLEGRGAVTLRDLTVGAPNTTLLVGASLHRLELEHWVETEPAPWAACGALQHVRLRASTVLRRLPASWVAACERLEKLHVTGAPDLSVLPPRLLAGAVALLELKLTGTKLDRLPDDLFDYSPRLQRLYLSDNELTSLYSGIFSKIESLRIVDLSHNLLTHVAASSLSKATSLRVLSLAHNAPLGDLCGGALLESPLHDLTQLNKLDLSGTNIKSICLDWRRGMPLLRELNLSNTNISSLKFEDLQHPRSAPGAKVYLQRSRIVELNYTASDYNRVLGELGELGGSSTSHKHYKATVHIETQLLRCDCNAYWAALMLRERPQPVALESNVRCRSNGAQFKYVPPEELTCPAPKECRGELAACACTERPDRARDRLVSVSCCARGLDRVPHLPPATSTTTANLTTAWSLRLPHNEISVVHLADMPPNLIDLDLSHNPIKNIYAAMPEKVAGLRTLQLGLSNISLTCDCHVFELLAAIRNNLVRLVDDRNVTCGGSPLSQVVVAPCVSWGAVAAALVVGLSVLVAAVLALATCAARLEVRLFVKKSLLRLGWLPRQFEPEGDGRRFDAFVSFAHEDAAVVEEIRARLEDGEQPLRLCLHYRDWAPGEWIPAQIAASVRASRRTVAVVSRHFLRSTWARAEFREAHAAALRDVTPRLVVVLLEEPAQLPLDRELAAYVRRNTYVLRDDPRFWDKLWQALAAARASPAGAA